MPITYEIKSDESVIEFKKKITHETKSYATGKLKNVKLKEDILVFIYLCSKTKQGKQVEFKYSDFERLVNQKLFVRLS